MRRGGFSFISFTFPHTSPSAWDIVVFSEYWFGKMGKANVKQSHQDGDLAEDVTSPRSRTSTLLPHHSKGASADPRLCETLEQMATQD